jgi:hypothetical protein
MDFRVICFIAKQGQLAFQVRLLVFCPIVLQPADELFISHGCFNDHNFPLIQFILPIASLSYSAIIKANTYMRFLCSDKSLLANNIFECIYYFAAYSRLYVLSIPSWQHVVARLLKNSKFLIAVQASYV